MLLRATFTCTEQTGTLQTGKILMVDDFCKQADSQPTVEQTVTQHRHTNHAMREIKALARNDHKL